MIDPEPRERGIWTLARYPALVIALTWSIALAVAVVLVPSQPTIGAVAIALAIPCLGLAFLVRPAVLAVAVAFALIGVGRAELPPTDAQAASRGAAQPRRRSETRSRPAGS